MQTSQETRLQQQLSEVHNEDQNQRDHADIQFLAKIQTYNNYITQRSLANEH